METYVIEKLNCKGDSTFHDLSWVIKAKSKDESRYNLQGVYFDGEAFIATDGYRLHYALMDLENIPHEIYPKEKGVYEVVSANKKNITLRLSTDREFPDYTQVFPNPRTFTNSRKCILGKTVTPLTTLARNAFSLFADKGCLNLKFLEDLAIDDEEWEIFFINHRSPVTFLNCSKLAIIMPVNIDLSAPTAARGEITIEEIPKYGRKFKVDTWGSTVEMEGETEPEDKEKQD